MSGLIVIIKGMKKNTYLLLCMLSAYPLWAQLSLPQVLPLLQQKSRTPAQTQQVLQIFRTAQDPNTVFAAGASLVKIPPTKTAEPALLNQIMQASDPLKTAFSAIILTNMGSMYEELSPLLQDTLQSKDKVLRSYAAGAYTLLNPTDKTYTADIVRLYIFDAALAQRAMNLLANTPKEQLNVLKKAATHQDPQVRSAAVTWLGTLHTQQATDYLLKRAKKESDLIVQSQLATALASNPDATLDDTLKGLRTNYQKPAATTYALALGFMTGHSINGLKTALLSDQENLRINAARAAAYMASVLANPDAFAYTSDRAFDVHLLKGLIAPLKMMAANGTENEQSYAENALTQIEKLM